LRLQIIYNAPCQSLPFKEKTLNTDKRILRIYKHYHILILMLISIITQYSGLYRYDSHISQFHSNVTFNGKFKEF
jgi:hypothetical protein